MRNADIYATANIAPLFCRSLASNVPIHCRKWQSGPAWRQSIVTTNGHAQLAMLCWQSACQVRFGSSVGIHLILLISTLIESAAKHHDHWAAMLYNNCLPGVVDYT